MNKKYIKYLSLIFIISISFGITSFANELIYENEEITLTDNKYLTEQGIFNDGWRLGTYYNNENSGFSPGKLPNDKLFKKSRLTGWYQSPEQLYIFGYQTKTPMYIGFKSLDDDGLIFGNNLNGKVTNLQYDDYLKKESNVAVIAKEGIPVVPNTSLDFNFFYFNDNFNDSITPKTWLLAFFKDENGKQLGTATYPPAINNPIGRWIKYDRTINIPQNAVSMSLQFYPLERSLKNSFSIKNLW